MSESHLHNEMSSCVSVDSIQYMHIAMVSVQAACRALETAIEQNHKEVELRTDSSYTIKGL